MLATSTFPTSPDGIKKEVFFLILVFHQIEGGVGDGGNKKWIAFVQVSLQRIDQIFYRVEAGFFRRMPSEDVYICPESKYFFISISNVAISAFLVLLWPLVSTQRESKVNGRDSRVQLFLRRKNKRLKDKVVTVLIKRVEMAKD